MADEKKVTINSMTLYESFVMAWFANKTVHHV